MQSLDEDQQGYKEFYLWIKLSIAAFCVLRAQSCLVSKLRGTYQPKQIFSQVSLPHEATLDSKIKTVSINSCLSSILLPLQGRRNSEVRKEGDKVE